MRLQYRGDVQVDVTPVIIPRPRLQALQERLMLFYTGIRRHAHQVLEEQIEKTKSGEISGNLSALGKLVDQSVEILCNSHHLSSFGELLHNGWVLKRELSGAISNPRIDILYERARRAGAMGGKLLGAGGGGFLLLFAEPDCQTDVRRALAELREVSFSFCSEGSRIVFYSP